MLFYRYNQKLLKIVLGQSQIQYQDEKMKDKDEHKHRNLLYFFFLFWFHDQLTNMYIARCYHLTLNLGAARGTDF